MGGFLGDSSLIFQEYTDKEIFCFEPMQENYQNILQTIKINHTSKIIPINKALGSRQEELEISCLGGGSSFIYQNKNAKKERIGVITLDSYVQEHHLEVGLIKVDVEGFEMEFLKGALETIKTQKPAMILSVYHSVNDFFKIKPFIESLDLGYQFQIFKPIDGNILIETCLLCEC